MTPTSSCPASASSWRPRRADHRSRGPDAPPRGSPPTPGRVPGAPGRPPPGCPASTAGQPAAGAASRAPAGPRPPRPTVPCPTAPDRSPPSRTPSVPLPHPERAPARTRRPCPGPHPRAAARSPSQSPPSAPSRSPPSPSAAAVRHRWAVRRRRRCAVSRTSLRSRRLRGAPHPRRHSGRRLSRCPRGGVGLPGSHGHACSQSVRSVMILIQSGRRVPISGRADTDPTCENAPFGPSSRPYWRYSAVLEPLRPVCLTSFSFATADTDDRHAESCRRPSEHRRVSAVGRSGGTR